MSNKNEKVTFEQFINGEFAINCRTMKAAIRLENMLNYANIDWTMIGYPTVITHCWREYRELSCYTIANNNRIEYGERDCYTMYNKKVILFSKFYKDIFNEISSRKSSKNKIRVIDKYNHDKVWVITITDDGEYYFYQEICGFSQTGPVKTTREYLSAIGILQVDQMVYYYNKENVRRIR